MPKSTNSYSKGLNQDNSRSKYDPNNYYHALNLKVITHNGLSTGSIENEKGNALSFKIPDVPADTYTHSDASTTSVALQENLKVIGWCSIDKYIVMFTSNSGGIGQIWKLEYDESTNQIKDLLVSGYLSVPKHLIFNGKLNFKLSNRIEAEGRYENSGTVRVYWTDFLNPLRSVNILDTELINTKADLIDNTPNLTFSIPQPIKIGNGQLPSGAKIQYAYRLLSAEGIATDMSPASPLVTLPTGDINTVTAYSMLRNAGGLNNTTTGRKSVVFRVKEIDTDYSIIQHIAVLYVSKNTPKIYQFGEDSIPSSGTMDVTVVGNETEVQVPETIFSKVSSGFSVCKTLDAKNNYLIVGNIKKEQTDITTEEWDARAYRFKTVDDSAFPDLISKADLEDLSSPITISNKTTASPDYDSVPVDHDAINPYNLERENYFWYRQKQYKYQKDGKTLGGSGKYVSYKFCSKKIDLDDSVDIVGSRSDVQEAPWLRSDRSNSIPASGKINIDGSDHTYDIINQFDNFSSPIIEALFTGYSRGEVYRFGIQFYTKKGAVTYVNWIGDIKFPDPISNTEVVSGAEDWEIANENSSNKLRGYSLGVEFTIDVSTIADKIGGFRIVRAERTEGDTTRLGTGTIMLEDRIGEKDKNEKLTLYSSMNPKTDANHDIHVGITRVKFIGNDKIGKGEWHLPDLPGPNLARPEYPHGKTLGKRDGLWNNDAWNGKRGARSRTILFTPFVQPGMDNYSSGGFRFDFEKGDYIKTIGYYNSYATMYNRTGNTNNANNKGKGNPHRNQKQNWVYKLRGWKRPDHSRIDSDSGQYFSGYKNGLNGCEAFPIKTLTHIDKAERRVSDHGAGLTNRYFHNISYGRGDVGHDNNAPFGVGADICRLELYSWWSELHEKSTSSSVIDGIYSDEIDDVFSHGFFDPGEWMDWNERSSGSYQRDDANRTKGIGRGTGTYGNDFGDDTGSLYKGQSQSWMFKEVSYVREVLKQYGGNTFENRSKTTYMSTGHFQAITGNSNQEVTKPEVYGGDVTVHVFAKEYIVPYYSDAQDPNDNLDKRGDYKMGIAVMYPCESRLNLEYHTASGPNFIANRTRTNVGDFINEVYDHDEFYTQQNNSEKKFVAKDFATIELEEYPHRLWLSNEKIDGELIDSWKKFDTADILDVDGSYGPINKVINFQDRLVFYQDHAIGVAAINETSIVNDTSGVGIALGTGTKLDQFRYLTTATGTVHQFSVAPSTTALYHYDVTLRKLYKLTQGPAALSDMKGMSSFFADNVDGSIVVTDKTLTGTGVHTVFDYRHNRMLFTFLSPKPNVNDFTIGYNEYMDAFESFYSYTPKIYLNTGRRMLSATTDPTDNADHVYLHDAGDYGSFYGSASNTEITLIVAENAAIPKIFTNIEYNSQISINDVDKYDQTLSSIEIWNDYQTTGKINLIVGTNIKRRIRHWRHVIGRASVQSNEKARIRDYSIYLKLTHSNTGNKRLVLHDIIVAYTPARD